MQLYEWIGKQIAFYRQEKKLSQTALAQFTDLSRGSIANIEKGRQQAPLHVLFNIAKVLGITPNRIIPIHNEHIAKDTNELIEEIGKMNNLTDTNREKLSEFFKNL